MTSILSPATDVIGHRIGILGKDPGSRSPRQVPPATEQPIHAGGRLPPVPEMQTWEAMRQRIHAQLERQTGDGVDEWNKKIAAAAPAEEPALREWLNERHVTGYPQMLLVWETFGYPDFLLASADTLVEAQFADRPGLRPILDAVIAAASDLGEVTIQARRTYVSLLTPRRTFAIVQPTTRKRIDLGLRLGDVPADGRLVEAKNLGNDAITHRIGLEAVEDLDTRALDWLRRAYDASR